jgi:hypothetical protein
MGSGFTHYNIILFLKNTFSKYFKAKTGIEIVFKNEYEDRKGSGDNEVLVYKMEGFVLINGELRDAKVPITFIENSAGEMEIFVDKKTVHEVKLKGRINNELIKEFTKAIRAYINAHSHG